MENKINSSGLAIIKRYEGLKLKTYLDAVGVPTIGFGHTGPDVEGGQTITQEQAEALLAHDVARFEEDVSELVEVELTSNQFSALVSFTFNLGKDALAQSTLLRLLNAGHVDQVPGQFVRWNKAGGKVQPGLVARRGAEAALFARA